MSLTITAFSTALFSTWIFVEDYGLLFDAGDGASAGLGLKSGKIGHIFISHADRDHVAGLLQLHQLNARHGTPTIYYPQDCGTFPALRDFMAQFDPQSGPATWHALTENEVVPLAKNLVVRTRPNRHVTSPGKVKSIDFTLCERRRKLKAELVGVSGPEIASLRSTFGEDYVTELHERPIFGYSSDTPALDAVSWKGVEVLLHEATFLSEGEAREAHSNLPQVLAAARELDVQTLVLTHFSSRYTHAEIRRAVGALATQHNLRFPIHAVLPGETVRDVLVTEPVWRPKTTS
jgi:ribonuclease Z